MASSLTRLFLLAALLTGLAFSSAPAAAQTINRAATTFTAPGIFVPTTSVAFGNGAFVALGLKGRSGGALSAAISAYTSPDGSVWTERAISIPNVRLDNHGVVRFVGNQFVFTGTTSTGSYVARSADGVSWTVTNPASGLPTANGFQEIVAGTGISLGIFATTLSAFTDNGTAWTERTAPGTTATAPYSDLTFGAGRFVLLAGGTSTRVWTSTDAATWTEILAGQQSSGRIAFGNGTFVLTGANYKTSTDGVNFTVRPTPANLTLTGTNPVRFVGGRFLCAQFTLNSAFQLVPDLIFSPDGFTWTRQVTYAADLAKFSGVDFAEGNNRLVVVGYEAAGTPLAPLNPAVVAVINTANLPTLPTGPVPPAITAQPLAQSAVLGTGVTFTIAATGTTNSYQWRKDNVAVAGATAATYTIASVVAASAGSYTVVITNSAGTVTSAAATLTLVSASDISRLSNLAVRTTLAANQILIVGVNMSGGAKPVLIRAAGPGLGALGVPGTMADPKLALFNGPTQIAANDNWAGDPAVVAANSALGAFPFPGPTSLDAALVTPVDGSRTVQVSGPTAGTIIVEAYDAGTGNTPRFTSISALNRVGTGTEVLIAGFTITGATTKNLLIRAVGPSLAAAPFNIGTALADPKLDLYTAAANPALLNSNDDYAASLATTFAIVGAFPLIAGSKDAALVVSLAPGSYTAQISGVAGTTGIAIVEIYELP